MSYLNCLIPHCGFQSHLTLANLGIDATHSKDTYNSSSCQDYEECESSWMRVCGRRWSSSVPSDFWLLQSLSAVSLSGCSRELHVAFVWWNRSTSLAFVVHSDTVFFSLTITAFLLPLPQDVCLIPQCCNWLTSLTVALIMAPKLRFSGLVALPPVATVNHWWSLNLTW